ncbi:hypothetical protein [Azospirillum argentinense]
MYKNMHEMIACQRCIAARGLPLLARAFLYWSESKGDFHRG